MIEHFGYPSIDGKTILVTGGCGFIGSNFIEYLFKYNKNVNLINLDKYGVGHRKLTLLNLHESTNNSYTEIKVDLCDLFNEKGESTRKHISNYKFDIVFHFAAESHVDRSISGPVSFIHNNVMALTNILEFVRTTQGNIPIFNVSTDEVYGHLGLNDTPFTTKSPLAPRSPYSASKASADMIADAYNETFGMRITTTRCCNNFGPHQHQEKFIPTIIRNLCNGTNVPIYGSGNNIREWIHVNDHNHTLLNLASKHISRGIWERHVNIGSGMEKTNLELTRMIASILDVPCLVTFVEDRKGHDFRYAISGTGVFYSDNRFEELLVDTVKFYQQQHVYLK